MIKKTADAIKKTEECLLRDIDMELYNSNIEAYTYFARKGKFLTTKEVLSNIWYERLLRRAQINILYDSEQSEIIINKKVPLKDIINILDKYALSVNPFSYYSNDHKIVNGVFIKAVEWFNVSDYQPIVESIAMEYSSYLPQEDNFNALWTFFEYTRSNLAIKHLNRSSIDAYLYTLLYGIEKNNYTNILNTGNYIPIYGMILYFSIRFKSIKISDSILDKCINILKSTQLKDGSWPIETTVSKGSLLATICSIYGLIFTKPKGWNAIINNAKNYMINIQQLDGSYYIQGAPYTWLNVLCLDSLLLTENNYNKIFKPINIKEKNEAIYDYSKEKWYNKSLPQTISESISKYKDFHPEVSLVTAVKIERDSILKQLKPLTGKKKIRKVSYGLETYYIGKFGCYDAIVTMCDMGSEGASGSNLTINTLIEKWNPKIIVLVGIAFGMDKEKHIAGDVLISKNIIPYEHQRVGDKTLQRNSIIPTSEVLINRIRNVLDWEFKRPDNTLVNIHIGDILSGEKLIDNIEFKERLKKEYPFSIGGEMEGSGLSAASRRHKKEYILIKSVCDWGDGKKKKIYQSLAAASSSSFCLKLFSDEYILDGL